MDVPRPTFPDRFNMASWFLDRNVVEGRGDRLAVRCGAGRWTYREVQALSNRAANALVELGVRPENRVLLVLPDGIEFVAAWFGTLKTGAVFAMANVLSTAEDYAYYLDYTRAPVVVVHEDVLPRLEAAVAAARCKPRLLVVGRAGGRHVEWEAALGAASDRFENADTARDEPAGWLFTSGTTGHPKAAVHCHRDFPWNTSLYAHHVLRMSADDVTVSVPKLFFGYATGTNLMFPFSVGGSTVLFPERSTPEKLFETIAEYRPTFLTSVPTLINAMATHPEAAKQDLSCLRLVVSAGEALPPELYRKWLDTFGVDILDGIGSAEMFHIYVSNRIGEVVPGSLGKVVPGYETKAVGPEGEDVAPGEIGTLWVRGESIALGYFQDKDKSIATYRGDWCVTGDLFRIDERGLHWYEGRADDLLKVSGIFVSPLEIEDCLLQHPGVAEVCVVGHTDAGGLVKPLAIVVPRAGTSASEALARELRELAKARLSPYKYPRWVRFVAGLPRNERGKVERKKIRDGHPLADVHPVVDLTAQA